MEYNFTIDQLEIDLSLDGYPKTIFGTIPVFGELTIHQKKTFNYVDEFLFICHEDNKYVIDWPDQIHWGKFDTPVDDKTKTEINNIVSRFLNNLMFW